MHWTTQDRENILDSLDFLDFKDGLPWLHRTPGWINFCNGLSASALACYTVFLIWLAWSLLRLISIHLDVPHEVYQCGTTQDRTANLTETKAICGKLEHSVLISQHKRVKLDQTELDHQGHGHQITRKDHSRRFDAFTVLP